MNPHMNKTFLYALSLMIFVSAHLTAQHMLPDSLRSKFMGVKQDSAYVVELNLLATNFLRTNPNASRVVSNHTLEVASKIKFTSGYARALTVIGNSYWYEGVYEFAQNYYLMAARQYQSI